MSHIVTEHVTIKSLPRYCVYVLADPDTGDVFYVGETNNFSRRKEQHFEGSDQLSGYKVKLLKADGKEPVMTTIEHCHSEEAAMVSEIAWIRHFIAVGAPLLNSQNFDGADERQAARKGMAATLHAVTGGKYQGEKLRHVANGRSYDNGGGPSSSSPQKYQRPPPKQAPAKIAKGDWMPWELEKLRTMYSKRMKPWDMARVLGRPMKSVQLKIKQLS